jgi:hypothetical protein
VDWLHVARQPKPKRLAPGHDGFGHGIGFGTGVARRLLEHGPHPDREPGLSIPRHAVGKSHREPVIADGPRPRRTVHLLRQ